MVLCDENSNSFSDGGGGVVDAAHDHRDSDQLNGVGVVDDDPDTERNSNVAVPPDDDSVPCFHDSSQFLGSESSTTSGAILLPPGATSTHSHSATTSLGGGVPYDLLAPAQRLEAYYRYWEKNDLARRAIKAASQSSSKKSLLGRGLGRRPPRRGEAPVHPPGGEQAEAPEQYQHSQSSSRGNSPGTFRRGNKWSVGKRSRKERIEMMRRMYIAGRDHEDHGLEEKDGTSKAAGSEKPPGGAVLVDANSTADGRGSVGDRTSDEHVLYSRAGVVQEEQSSTSHLRDVVDCGGRRNDPEIIPRGGHGSSGSSRPGDSLTKNPKEATSMKLPPLPTSMTATQQAAAAASIFSRLPARREPNALALPPRFIDDVLDCGGGRTTVAAVRSPAPAPLLLDPRDHPRLSGEDLRDQHPRLSGGARARMSDTLVNGEKEMRMTSSENPAEQQRLLCSCDKVKLSSPP